MDHQRSACHDNPLKNSILQCIATVNTFTALPNREWAPAEGVINRRLQNTAPCPTQHCPKQIATLSGIALCSCTQRASGREKKLNCEAVASRIIISCVH